MNTVSRVDDIYLQTLAALLGFVKRPNARLQGRPLAGVRCKALLGVVAAAQAGCDSGALRARSRDEPSPRHIERVIDQNLHPFDETNRTRQARVMVECSFVYPA